MNTPALKVEGLYKCFRAAGGATVIACDVAHFEVAAGESVALQAPSGAGKTVFLQLVAGLMRPDRGEIRIAGTRLPADDETARDRVRGRLVGYVPQAFHLLPALTAYENVAIAQRFGASGDPEAPVRLLTRMGLGDRLAHRPSALSLGQQQRVAVARALVNRPALVLADEPTSSLDATRGAEVLDLLLAACAEAGATLVVATHDETAARRCGRAVALASLVSDAPVVGTSPIAERGST